MRVLVLTQFWPPEVGAAAEIMSDLAARLAAAGDEVDVVTGLPNYPTGVVPEEYRRGRRDESWQGVRVRRAWVLASPTKRTGQRVLGHLSLALTSLPRALGTGRPDVVVVNSPPLFLALSALVVGRIRRAPVVVEISDLHPESAIEYGLLPPGPGRWLAWRLADLVYLGASGIVAVTEGVAAGLRARGVPDRKVRLIRYGADTERFRPGVTSEWRERQGLGGGVLALYAGMFGRVQALDTIRDAAALLADTDVRVALVGDGADRDALARAQSDRFRVLPAEPIERMPEVVAGADIALVSLRDLEIVRGAIPVKLVEAMAAAKPVVLASPEGEATAIVRGAGCGIVVPPEDPRAMAEAIRTLAQDPERRRAMGQAGRNAAERDLSRAASAARVREFLAEVARR